MDNGMNGRGLLYLIWLMLFSLTVGVFWSCEENPVEIPLSTLPLNSDTLYATFDTTHRLDKVVTTLGANRLIIGSVRGYTFRPILKFLDFPLDIVSINTAFIEFKKLSTLGDPAIINDPNVSLTVTGYPILQPWKSDTSEVWEGDYQNNVDFNIPLGSMTLYPTDTVNTPIIFQFDSTAFSFILQWADTSLREENAGMILEFSPPGFPTDPQFVEEFVARDQSTNEGPKLVISYRDTLDSLRIDTVLVGFDASLFRGDLQTRPDRDYVTTFVPLITVVSFNLDTLIQLYPNGVSIVNADLEMPVDWDETLAHPALNPNMRILPLTSALTDTNVSVDTSFLSFNLSSDFTQFTEDSAFVRTETGPNRQSFVRNMVQNMLNNPDRYTGFYLEPRSFANHVAIFSFFRYNAPDPRFRPRLIIQSVALPKERF